MKRIYFLLFVVVVIFVSAVVIVFGPAFDKSNHTNKIAKYISDALEQDNLTAQYHDDVHVLDSK